ncbi:hypothetical protein BOX15_Mlig000160g1 [Macrostomum lignano]|uniref:PKD domain-containing protein n=1 Tax=Macrostomum lignano TaxID=282301 RepID=A0A267F6B5_9PLAT|nr:hypothetical protein BOX15_Mlig000160g1 [Macrostomum lignano]
MTNWIMPSFIDNNYSNKDFCFNVSSQFKCQGIPMHGASLKLLPNPVKYPSNLSISIKWFNGTYIDAMVYPDWKNTVYRWNWLENDNATSFHNKEIHYKVSYGLDLREHNVTVRYYNNFTTFTKTQIVLVNPELESALLATISYQRAFAPLNVTFSLQMAFGDTGSYLLADCTFNLYFNANHKFTKLRIPVDKQLNFTFVYSPKNSVVKSTLTCENHFGSVRKDFEVRLYPPIDIYGLSAWVKKTAWRTFYATNVFLNVTNGTDVTYYIWSSGGNNVSKVHPEPVSFWEELPVPYKFTKIGIFDLFVSAKSSRNSETTRISGIVAQNPIIGLNLSGSPDVACPPGTFDLQLSHTGAKQPTNVTCNTTFLNKSSEQEVVLSNSPLALSLSCTQEALALQSKATVLCWNLVSSAVATFSVTCTEAVSGLVVTASQLATTPGVNISISALLTNGTDVVYDFEFGDSTEPIRIESATTFAKDSSAIVYHAFELLGNYTVVVNASNGASWQIGRILIIVIEELVDLEVTHDKVVLYLPGISNFFITNLPNHTSSLVLCDFQFSNFGSRRTFNPRLTDQSNETVSFTFPKESIGQQYVAMTCRNPLSAIPIVRNYSIEIELDAVIIANFTTNGTVWDTFPTEFHLKMKRIGADSCIIVRYNGTLSEDMFGFSRCRSIAEAEGRSFKEINHFNLSLSWSRVFPTYDDYLVTVEAYNEVSNDTASLTASVIDWPCFHPVVKLFGSSPPGLLLADQIIQTLRSEDVNVTSENAFNCTKQTNLTNRWQVSTKDASLQICTRDEERCSLIRRSLPYGLCNVSLTVDLAVKPPVFTTVWFLVNVSKTPLHLEPIQGPDVVDYNTTVSLSVSARDWDEEEGNYTGMKFEWVCLRVGETETTNFISIPTESDVRALPTLAGCFGNGPGVILGGNQSHAASLSISSYNMFPNITYELIMRLAKDSRQVIQKKLLTVRSQPNPVGRLQCVDNCGLKATANRAITFELICDTNCGNKFKPLGFELTIVRVSESWSELGSRVGGAGEGVLSIPPSEISAGTFYRVEGRMWNYMPENSVRLERIVVVNGPPVGGACTVTPTVGQTSKTTHEFECTDWREFGNISLGPLRYKVAFYRRDMGQRATILETTDSCKEALSIPLGEPLRDFAAEIIFTITDASGLKTERTVPIKSFITDYLAEVLTRELTLILWGNASALAQQLSDGNYQLASNTLLTVAGMMNAWNEDGEGAGASAAKKQLFTANMTKLRDRYMKVVNDFPTSTAGEVDRVATLIIFGAQKPQQFSLTAQTMAQQKLTQMVGDMWRLQNEVSLNEQLAVSTKMMDCGLAVWNATRASVSGLCKRGCSGQQQADSGTAKSSVRETMRAIMSVFDSLGQLLLHSSPQFTVSRPGYAYFGVLEQAAETDGSAQRTLKSTQGSVKLPRMSSIGTNGCSVRLLLTDANPYHWDESADQLSSSVLSNWISNCSAHRVKRSAAIAAGKEYLMKLDTGSMELKTVRTTPADQSLMVYHSFVSTGDPVQLIILPEAGVQLEVFIEAEMKPDPMNCTWQYVMPKTLGNGSSDSAILLPADSFLPNQTVNVGLRRLGCIRDENRNVNCTNHTVSYSFGIVVQNCYAWNSSSDSWVRLSSAECQPNDEATASKASFRVNLFGSLGAGVSFVPNTIDFGTLFDNWSGKLADSRAVVATVATLWVLFLPFAVLLRRLDKRDDSRFRYLPLVDDKAEAANYRVQVFTGSYGSEVPLGVFFTVRGQRYNDRVRTLSDGLRENFTPGNVDNLSFTAREPLGDIKSISLSYEGTLSGSGCWYLGRVIVTDCSTNRRYIFVWENAVPPDEEIVIKCASSSELKHTKNLTRNHLSRRMQDDHTWLSIATRKTESNFSRLERFAVCWNLLFMTMIANAMWYGVADNSSEMFSIGPFKVSYGTLITSILGSLTVMPVSMATVILFLKSRAKLAPSDYEVPESSSPEEKKTEHQPKRIFNPDSTSCEEHSVIEQQETSWQLPHWCRYIAWVLLLSSVVTAGVFIVFYAMDWGQEKSEAWLIAFFLSFSETVLIIQPLKVLLIGLVMALFLRKDYDLLDSSSIRVRQIVDSQERFLNLSVVQQMEASNEIRKKAKCALFEIILSVIYIFLLYCVCFGSMDTESFYLNQNLRRMLRENNSSPGFSLNKVQKYHDVYSWLQHVALPAFFPTNAVNGRPLSSEELKFMADGTGYRLGHVSLRQLRIRPHFLRHSVAVSAKFGRDSEDTGCYDVAWRASETCNESDADPLKTAFRATHLSRWSTFGQYGWYSGGGYVLALPSSFSQALSTVAAAKETQWLTNLSRAVLVESNLFYPDTNFFTSLTVLIELMPFGGTVSSISLHSSRLYRYIGATGVFRLCAEILTAIGTLLLLAKQIYSWRLEGIRRYSTNIWHLIRLATVVAMIVGLSCLVARSIMTVTALEEVLNSATGVTNGLTSVMFLDESFYYCLGVAMFFSQISFLNTVKYSRSLAHLGRTLQNSISQFNSFVWAFLIIFFAFCFASYLVLGSSEPDYKSITDTAFTQLIVMLGKLNVNFGNKHSIVATFLLFGYSLIMIFIAVNIFVALLNESYYAGLADLAASEEDFQTLDSIVQLFKSLLRKDAEQEYIGEIETDDPVRHVNDVLVSLTSRAESEDLMERQLESSLRAALFARPTGGRDGGAMDSSAAVGVEDAAKN